MTGTSVTPSGVQGPVGVLSNSGLITMTRGEWTTVHPNRLSYGHLGSFDLWILCTHSICNTDGLVGLWRSPQDGVGFGRLENPNVSGRVTLDPKHVGGMVV